MKKISLLLSVCSLSLAAHAQFNAGLRAGINFSQEDYGNNFYRTSRHTFFAGGAFANYFFKPALALQMEVLHSSEGTEEEYPSGNSTITGTVTIQRINIPLLFKYRHSSGVFAQTGPQVGLLLSAKGKYTTGHYNFKSNTSSAFFSWVVGLGYEIKAVPGLGAELRYQPGLSDIKKGTVNATSIKGSTLNVSVFYTLFKGKK